MSGSPCEHFGYQALSGGDNVLVVVLEGYRLSSKSDGADAQPLIGFEMIYTYGW